MRDDEIENIDNTFDVGRTLLPPRQHGATWRESEYRTLADDLRAGVDLRRTAATLGRTPSAVEAVLKNFVPPEERLRAAVRERWIRQRLIAEPEWDWWAVVHDNHANSPSSLWRTEDEHRARIGWRRKTPMPVLAQELDTSELMVAELLRSLGLAEGIADVVDRLGATPGLALAKRYRALRDEEATASWILVVDGAEGTVKPKGAPVKRQLSLHESRAAAEAERDRVLSWHDRAAEGSTGPVLTVWWTIAQRSIGGVAGKTRSGVHTPPNAETGPRADSLRVGDRLRIDTPDGDVIEAIVRAVEQNSAGETVVVDLGPVAGSRVHQIIAYDPAEVVDVIRGEAATG